MLIFESLSAGMFALLVALTLVLVLVGIYVSIVWPITKWDLASVNPQKYRSWWEGALWLVFAAGSAAGLWCFSGAAFREEPARVRDNAQRNPAKQRS
jgi:uncharacterized membrane protein